jgi:hypothetical protein
MRWGLLSALAALLIFAQSAGAQAGRIAFDFEPFGKLQPSDC